MFYTIKQKNKDLYIMIDDLGIVQKTNNKKDCMVFGSEDQAKNFIENHIEDKRYITNKELLEVVNVDEVELY